MDDQVNIRDIKSSRCNISGNKTAELVLLETLESDFSLVLRDVSVHDFNIVLDLLVEQKRVGISLGGSKHD